MFGVIDEEELQPVERQRDTELTLGPMLLLGLFFGLVLLCGLCFGLGYSMGSRGAHDSPATGAAGQQPGAQTSSSAASSLPKPSAIPQNISRTPQQAVADLPSSEASGAGAAADSQNSGSTSAPAANSAQPVVKPALAAAATAPTPASGQPAPATAPTLSLMVQIAAVSHQEDADVLVGALRKRGYAVTVRRDAADSQFHVRIGPFTSRNDANATRQKLLNDGYNAIVQP